MHTAIAALLVALALPLLSVRGQTISALAERDPRVQMARDFHRYGLPEESKRLLIQMLHDGKAGESIRGEAAFLLGEIAMAEGDTLIAYEEWSRLVEEQPGHARSAEASRQMERLLAAMEERLRAGVPAPRMWVRTVVEVGRVTIGDKEIIVRGIGYYQARTKQTYARLVELTSPGFWLTERALIAPSEIEQIERAVEAMNGTVSKWKVRPGQSGGTAFRTEDGFEIGFFEHSGGVIWYVSLGSKRINIVRGLNPEFLPLLRKADQLVRDADPSLWFSDQAARTEGG